MRGFAHAEVESTTNSLSVNSFGVKALTEERLFPCFHTSGQLLLWLKGLPCRIACWETTYLKGWIYNTTVLLYDCETCLQVHDIHLRAVWLSALISITFVWWQQTVSSAKVHSRVIGTTDSSLERTILLEHMAWPHIGSSCRTGL